MTSPTTRRPSSPTRPWCRLVTSSSVDGAAITPAKTAVGKTDANGLSTIVVYSEKVGKTLTEAVADYPENPYPEQLFDHETFQNNCWWHNYDWDDQPTC